MKPIFDLILRSKIQLFIEQSKLFLGKKGYTNPKSPQTIIVRSDYNRSLSFIDPFQDSFRHNLQFFFIKLGSIKEFVDQEINISKTIIPYNKYILSDYTIRGDIKSYEQKLLRLREVIKEKYPSICVQMQEHMDKYDKDKKIHLSALEAIVRCIVSLEKPIAGSKKFLLVILLKMSFSSMVL